jgi:hypothetical protein
MRKLSLSHLLFPLKMQTNLSYYKRLYSFSVFSIFLLTKNTLNKSLLALSDWRALRVRRQRSKRCCGRPRWRASAAGPSKSESYPTCCTRPAPCCSGQRWNCSRPKIIYISMITFLNFVIVPGKKQNYIEVEY